MIKLTQTVEFRVAITNDGKLGLFAQGDVDPEVAKRALERIMETLGSDEILLGDIAPVEKHRDDARTQVVHDLTHHKH